MFPRIVFDGTVDFGSMEESLKDTLKLLCGFISSKFTWSFSRGYFDEPKIVVIIK